MDIHGSSSCAMARLVLCAWLILAGGGEVAAQSTGSGTVMSEGADREARALSEAATIAFEEGRFESARDHFARAYALSRRPELLFNQGSCAERLRLDREAVDFYRRYLDAIPTAHNRAYVENRIRILEATIAASIAPPGPPRAEPIALPTPAAAGPVAQTETDRRLAIAEPPDGADLRDARRPVWKRGWFWALVGTAAAAAIAVPIGVVRASGPDYAPYESGSTGRTVFTLVGR